MPSEEPDTSAKDRQELEDRRTKALVEGLVDEHIARRWTLVSRIITRVVLPAVAAVAAALGIQGYLTWDALVKRKAEIESLSSQIRADADSAKKSAADAGALLSEAKATMAKAEGRLDRSSDFLQKSTETMSRSNEVIFTAQEKSAGLLGQLTTQAQSTIADSRKASEALTELQVAKSKAVHDVDEYLSKQLQSHDQQVTELKAVNERLRSTAKMMVALRASDTLLLRTSGQAAIRLPNVCDDSSASTYVLAFTLSEKIRNDFKVAYKAKLLPSGPEVTGRIGIVDAMKKGEPNPVGEIPETPFEFEAFIYHDMIASDFAVLKIRPRRDFRCPGADAGGPIALREGPP